MIQSLDTNLKGAFHMIRHLSAALSNKEAERSSIFPL